MKAALREKSTVGFSNMSFDELVMVNGGSSEIGYGLGGHSVVSSTNNSIGSTGNFGPSTGKEIRGTVYGFSGVVLGLAGIATLGFSWSALIGVGLGAAGLAASQK